MQKYRFWPPKTKLFTIETSKHVGFGGPWYISLLRLLDSDSLYFRQWIAPWNFLQEHLPVNKHSWLGRSRHLSRCISYELWVGFPAIAMFDYWRVYKPEETSWPFHTMRSRESTHTAQKTFSSSRAKAFFLHVYRVVDAMPRYKKFRVSLANSFILCTYIKMPIYIGWSFLSLGVERIQIGFCINSPWGSWSSLHKSEPRRRTVCVLSCSLTFWKK